MEIILILFLCHYITKVFSKNTQQWREPLLGKLSNVQIIHKTVY